VTAFHRQLLAAAPALHRLARTVCDHREEAGDLVQDVLERALRSRAPPANLDAWLAAILRNRRIDLIRQRHEAGGEPDELPSPAFDDEPRSAGLDAARLRDAVRKLAPPYRAVYVLHALHGFHYDAVARRMGITRATVGTRLHRARLRLRDLLEPHLERGSRERDVSLAQRRALAASSASRA
jgi:RNA polymerase sigma-70 factor (ECF subfamily)